MATNTQIAVSLNSGTRGGLPKTTQPKMHRAIGCDQMPAKVLKIVSQNLATPLASIINASINQCRFPQDLKLVDVSPVYKRMII